MIRCVLSCVFGFLLLLAGYGFAADQPFSRQLELITSSSIAPYVIAEENRGLVVDIIREALSERDYEVNFIYTTNRRLFAELRNQRVDGAFNLPPGNYSEGGYYLSDPVVYYQNVVVTLSDHAEGIIKVDDLKDKRLVVFQNAPLYLPPEYARMAAQNPHIEEVVNQQSQVQMLFLERADAIILDKRIFHYYLNQLQSTSPIYQAPYTVHPLFNSAPRYAIFKSAKLRDLFNQRLQTLKDNGRYEAIADNYLKLAE
ncbi:ABC-type amino acid transport/signal transduction systems, periplasmic component/domain [Hahella chejuensis KCTC 2396]|uniref:ABC-type amino acid transport/signal transduction systems, periplasmic component/domain n=1 Tax=Hahella chejuensis (strain KCTC 2396) TaxID=349521 RepID=Q2SHQ2_HAHCH|nr:transporter substrate-binding domain-containing protein [Hahella chejuensis]ABC29822.1 ABC-type amino acid transport/signal transduction systems, periplasmic component/domain [Hahella chejuensis KCTC 2396]